MNHHSGSTYTTNGHKPSHPLPGRTVLRAACTLVSAWLAAGHAGAASFSITGSSTSAQTLGGGSGQTGSVAATGSLTVGGSAVAVTISGGNATLTNLGSIIQSGTGRVVRDNTGVSGLVITNGGAANSTALMQSADADVIQMNKTPAGVTLNNYGTITSLNASKGGAQAVDFTAILSGGNTINNYSTGLIQARDADAVRPGANGLVYNDGTIKSTVTTDAGSDGIDAQNNSGVGIVNAASDNASGANLIEGARHGITGGAVDNATVFTMSISNRSYGTIRGNNGAGVNIDGFNANETITLVNNGLITGNGGTGDGDGVDVDGLANITNTGIIRSLNSFSSAAPAQSEGITIGGGTIINSGVIEGLVAGGNTNAVGRGITLAGIDTTGSPEPIYGNSSITNQSGGLIRGQTDSAIVVGGAASGFTVQIRNESGATIRGGGLSTAAIITGADNDTIRNSGLIDGSSSGKAIHMGAGENHLFITGGGASILGDIDGGSGGNNSVVIDPGAGGAFSYGGSLSNFSSAEVKSGTVTLSGQSTFTGTTAVSGGTLVLNGNISTSILTTVESGGTLAGTGTVGSLSVTSGGNVSPGNSAGILHVAGNYSQTGGSLTVDLGGIAAGSQYDQLHVSGSVTLGGSLVGNVGYVPAYGDLLFILANDGGDAIQGAFDGMADQSTVTFGDYQWIISYTADYAGNNSGTFTGGNDIALKAVSGTQAVPEPSTWFIACMASLTLFTRRRTGFGNVR